LAFIRRTASAVWSGTHKDGRGALTTESLVLSDSPYAFATRFGDGKGTNPKELVAAAHAGCLNMALAFRLTAAGYSVERLRTEARLTLMQKDNLWHISTVDLKLEANAPGISPDALLRLATEAKENCAISRSLRAEVTLSVGTQAT
jgi:osmotically inducible protein OsmC